MTPDVMPSFKSGSQNDFLSWLNNKMVYPRKAVGKDLKGEVEASFIIEKDGKLSGIEILKSTDELFSKEVIRALKKSPRWTSGTVNGLPVRTRLTMPITFLEPDEPKTLSTEGKKVDVMHKFQGGDINKFTKWVMSKVVFPNSAADTKYNVRITFVVDETGYVTDINVINTGSETSIFHAKISNKSSFQMPFKRQSKAV